MRIISGLLFVKCAIRAHISDEIFIGFIYSQMVTDRLIVPTLDFDATLGLKYKWSGTLEECLSWQGHLVLSTWTFVGNGIDWLMERRAELILRQLQHDPLKLFRVGVEYWLSFFITHSFVLLFHFFIFLMGNVFHWFDAVKSFYLTCLKSCESWGLYLFRFVSIAERIW